ncbi:BH3 interacting domain death agonist [Tachysurus fulvidraco]|uniref:BH3 interacting domain death agonist n=1 Tax=Tachysurus fulvidraco TaxID=1234273 RepID=UPI000F509B01|nr:BH3 interacting domain death agonist [Tachysurus fulvidraco]XP_047678779.1 BH3 interacting domain death agonist [Tachysurus fulvidraco]XP_047678780.1 BH3 interacting domain death agonist [Tachysurus fulvidraco]
MTDIHSSTKTPLLFLTFLQQSPDLSRELQKELEDLQCDVKLRRNPAQRGLNDHILYSQDHDFDYGIECDGELQTDGHSFPRCLLNDVPQDVLAVTDEDHVVTEVAAELIRMADEFNRRMVSEAAERLTEKLNNSSPEDWWSFLNQGVDGLLGQVPGSHTERVVMALTFSLVKAACEHTPSMLRDLYNTITQYNFRTSHQ